jgi:hypothetical protein
MLWIVLWKSSSWKEPSPGLYLAKECLQVLPDGKGVGCISLEVYSSLDIVRHESLRLKIDPIKNMSVESIIRSDGASSDRIEA